MKNLKTMRATTTVSAVPSLLSHHSPTSLDALQDFWKKSAICLEKNKKDCRAQEGLRLLFFCISLLMSTFNNIRCGFEVVMDEAISRNLDIFFPAGDSISYKSDPDGWLATRSLLEALGDGLCSPLWSRRIEANVGWELSSVISIGSVAKFPPTVASMIINVGQWLSLVVIRGLIAKFLLQYGSLYLLLWERDLVNEGPPPSPQ